MLSKIIDDINYVYNMVSYINDTYYRILSHVNPYELRNVYGYRYCDVMANASYEYVYFSSLNDLYNDLIRICEGNENENDE